MEKKSLPTCAEIGQALEPVFSTAPKVLSAILFGSHATGNYTGKSDIDIAVFVRDPVNFLFQDRLALHGDCCRMLHRNDVDLVVMNQLANLILLEHIIREGKVINIPVPSQNGQPSQKIPETDEGRFQAVKECGVPRGMSSTPNRRSRPSC